MVAMKRCILYRLRILTSIKQSLSSKLSLKLHFVHFNLYNNNISNQNITTFSASQSLISPQYFINQRLYKRN